MGRALIARQTVRHVLPLALARPVQVPIIPSVASLKPVSQLTATQLSVKRVIRLPSIHHVLCAAKDMSSLRAYAQLVLLLVPPVMDSYVKLAKKEIICFRAHAQPVQLVVIHVRMGTPVQLVAQGTPTLKSPRTVLVRLSVDPHAKPAIKVPTLPPAAPATPLSFSKADHACLAACLARHAALMSASSAVTGTIYRAGPALAAS